jgi:leucyl/phenylalanyl-tRNA--protein transferase
MTTTEATVSEAPAADPQPSEPPAMQLALAAASTSSVPSAPPLTAESSAEAMDFRPGVNETLCRYFTGWYPCHLGQTPDTPVGWRKYSHRGIHWLDQEKIHIPSRQKRYIFSPKFQLRFNAAFEEVLLGCADLARQGHTWITPGLMDVFCQLHDLGFAHSFECWQEGQLVGGAFGIQIGGMMTMESMFHSVDHAGKAMYVQTLYRLMERGFKLVDVNSASDHLSRFGAETVPQWQFERHLRDALQFSPTLGDEFPAPTLPLSVKVQIPLARIARVVGKKLRLVS